MLQPLCIRNLQLENNLLQAPLAGYSSSPFRKLAWDLGRPGLLATEMISARALALGAPRQERYLALAEEEGPVAFQLWGCDPQAMATATRIVTECGADVVDLNCGCPVRKVRAAGAGSKLMEDVRLLGRLVRAMRGNTHLPVTVKIRVGTGAGNYNGPEIARVAEAEGADLITVHGRHTRESYNTPCRLGEIARVVRSVSIPVIGNGDVVDGRSAERMFRETGCAGIMIGRACMGAPWVFRQIRLELGGGEGRRPEPAEIGRILLEHHDRLARLIGADTAVRHCRKLGCFYARGLQGSKDFRRRLSLCHDRDDFAGLVAEFFGKA